MDSSSNWYALRIDSKLCKAAAAGLRGKGFESYLPLYRIRRRWSDRVKEIEAPLFPGYVFCRFNPLDRRVPVLTTPGVMNIVGAGRAPIPIPDEEVDAVRTMVDSGLAVQPWPFLGVGSKVYIDRGPLTGLEGIITGDKADNLVVSVTLLQRSVAVTIQREWVRRIEQGDNLQAA
jgi:transcription antitermination factor NusG